jgi:uncharacterized protein YrrD
MLTNANSVKGLVIRAKDGEIGTVDKLYFDDETWAIRYLKAETGSWLDDLEGRQPIAVTDEAAIVDLAFNGTADKLARLIDHTLGKLHLTHRTDPPPHEPTFSDQS